MLITLGILDGDGIGPEIVSSAERVLKECETRGELEVEYKHLPVGWSAYEKFGSTMPQSTLEGLGLCDGWLLGPMLNADYPEDDAIYPNSGSGVVRKHFDLYANIRPAKSIPNISKKYRDVDIVIFRQNTEGFYADRNMKEGIGMFKPSDDISLSVRVITKNECRKIAERAFEYAERYGYSTVTAVHKKSVFKHAASIFLKECEAVSKEFPKITLADANVDAVAMELIRNPEGFEIIVTTNMYGDILSDEAVGLTGSLGLGAGLNAGDDFAMAQATHGAAPDIAGEGIANPTSMILSTQMLLRWIGEVNEYDVAVENAERIASAVVTSLETGEILTPDVGGTATTAEFTTEVVNNLFDEE